MNKIHIETEKKMRNVHTHTHQRKSSAHSHHSGNHSSAQVHVTDCKTRLFLIQSHQMPSILTSFSPTLLIWPSVLPLEPSKTIDKAQEILNGEKNTFCPLFSSHSFLNSSTAKVVFAAQRLAMLPSLGHKTHRTRMDHIHLNTKQLFLPFKFSSIN